MQNLDVTDGGAISLTLDRVGGAGFESRRAFSFGTFSVDAKMPRGYSAGVCATFFLQSGDYDHRNEWDFEFLGSPNNSRGMTLQTNVFMNGQGDQEVLTAFAFDPAAAFHTYTIQWGPQRTVWLVDGVNIRTVSNSSPHYPKDPMKVYFSIWDASPWATGPRTARIPVNYDYAPFTVDITIVHQEVDRTICCIRLRYVEYEKTFGGGVSKLLSPFIARMANGKRKIKVDDVDAEGEPTSHEFELSEEPLKGHKYGGSMADCIKLCKAFALEVATNLHTRMHSLKELEGSKLYKVESWPDATDKRERRVVQWLDANARVLMNRLLGGFC
ncbi:unnamed protein product [Closterium sp. NIES-64]|nr:unnamed protein product [Closterium sp. NIES-64]